MTPARPISGPRLTQSLDGTWDFRGRVHAGTVVGWVHRPAGFVVEKRLGAASC